MSINITDATAQPVLDEVLEERRRQHEKHGDQSHLPDGVLPYGPTVILDAIGDRTGRSLAAYSNEGLSDALRERTKTAAADGSVTLEQILTEEWGEVLASTTSNGLRTELIQLAAVAVQWVETLDARHEVTE